MASTPPLPTSSDLFPEEVDRPYTRTSSHPPLPLRGGKRSGRGRGKRSCGSQLTTHREEVGKRSEPPTATSGQPSVRMPKNPHRRGAR